MALQRSKNVRVRVAVWVLAGIAWAGVRPASAQTPDWNRKLEGVAVLRSPEATGGNLYDIHVRWSLVGDDATAMIFPQNLDTGIDILVNGTVLSSGVVSAQLDPFSGDCLDCNGSCSELSCGSINGGDSDLNCVQDRDCLLVGDCECIPDCACKGPGPSCMETGCAPDLPIATIPLNTGDEIMVILYPPPGALPDGDPSDDVRVMTFDGEGALWHRRIDAVELTPSPVGEGFYDLEVQWQTATHGIDYAVDLSSIVEILINGVPSSSFPETRLHYPTPCSQATPPPAGDCSATISCGFMSSGGAGGPGLDCAPDCLDGGTSYPCWCQCQGTELLALPVGPLQPGDEIMVLLRPAPGALPELPGFEEDDEDMVQPGGGCAATAHCADLDADGIRDSNCIWWECDSTATCNATFIPFADMGGANGACPPDLTTDANDRFHAINCFSNQDTFGNPGYPCEPNPPSALNVDAGGPFGSCIPDGVCDGNDGFHALNAFNGSSTCSCAMGPAPGAAGAAPDVVAGAHVTLIPLQQRVLPGQTVEIDVYIENALPDLRGYQLHAGVIGAGRSSLRLIDIHIDARKAVALPAQRWQGFNVSTAQMVAGLDAAGVATPQMSYLATFTYAVGAKAGGTVVVDLLHDDGDATQRTFLFPSPAHARIEIVGTTPATLIVDAAGGGRERR